MLVAEVKSSESLMRTRDLSGSPRSIGGVRGFQSSRGYSFTKGRRIADCTTALHDGMDTLIRANFGVGKYEVYSNQRGDRHSLFVFRCFELVEVIHS